VRKIIIATKNPGKYREIRKLLKNSVPKGFRICSLQSIGKTPDIIENGKTYLANALKKAKTIAKLTNSIVISDDSGLEVKALDNRPGIKSARFSGKNSTDKLNNKKLLKLLKNVEKKKRGARFVCTAVAYFPDSKITIHATGAVSGLIIEKETGSDGFGFDPLFYYTPLKKTFAQIPLSQKNNISHRYKAFKKLGIKIKPVLKKVGTY